MGRYNTPTRVIANRARHRAVALLVEAHHQEFEDLLAKEKDLAKTEFYLLQSMSEGEDLVRLSTGPRKLDQPNVRIEVGICRRCHRLHDDGHHCPHCGWQAKATDYVYQDSVTAQSQQPLRRRPTPSVRTRETAATDRLTDVAVISTCAESMI